MSCCLCNAKTVDGQTVRPVSGGVCEACARRMGVAAPEAARALAEKIDAPVLVMQGQPRQVFVANGRALVLFKKGRAEAESHRGGEVFDCVNAFTPLGCGKDPGCDDCRIKTAVVAALDTGSAATGVVQPLQVREGTAVRDRRMEVSAERVGRLVLLRIDGWE